MLCFYKHPMPRASKARSVQKAGISFIDRMTQSHPINKQPPTFEETPTLSRHPDEDRDL